MKKYNVAVVGATGLVGSEMINTLVKRNFPINNLRLFASHRSAGKQLEIKGEKIVVEDVDKSDFSGIQIALFAGGKIASRDYAHKFVEKGAVVIDNSNAFRMDADVPLIVPEVNPHQIKNHKGIIANPNCSTIVMVVVLKPIYDEAGIERIVVSTYQSVSGTGKDAVEELLQGSRAVLDNQDYSPKVYPHPIAFNLLPHIGPFTHNGYTSEEMKMVYETRKIMEDSTIKVSATTVRVATQRGHSESVNIKTKKKISVERVRELLDSAPGVILYDDPAQNIYPHTLLCDGKDEVFVGRIREDISQENGLDLFLSGDNLLKGAALNAVQIAQLLI